MVSAARMGITAIDALKNGRFNRVVVNNHNVYEDVDIDEALKLKKTFREDLFNVCERLAF